MRLLWRHTLPDVDKPSRTGLTIDRVVEVAIDVADSDGLAAVTIRRVAQELGVSTMTPYSYVPRKAELINLMLDELYARMAVTINSGDAWRGKVTAVAADNRTLHRSHPWTVEAQAVRPALGPGMLSKYERELSAFDGIGLTDLEMDAALAHLLGIVRVTVRAELQAAETIATTGTDDDAWWETTGPLLAELAHEEDYPLATRVGTAAGLAYGSAFSADAVYEFGLQRFLDGLQRLLCRRH
jgi:AcrR family transcriptional regulator